MLGRKEEGGPQCQEPIHHTRRSTGGGSSSWRARGAAIDELAREFEASANAIRKWVKQSGLDEGLRSDGLTTAEREELNRLRRENRVLREEREILGKSRGLVRDGDRHGAVTAFQFVSANQAMYGIATMCRVLAVSASGYYAWLKRPLSARARADAELIARITAIHQYSRETYGAPRIHEELSAAGIHVGCKRVARLMRAAGLRGVSRRRWVSTTVRDRNARPAPDLVDRNFIAAAPNCLWVADITYIPTWAGFLYLAVVLDTFSRSIVGWAMATHLRTELVLEALNMALGQRRPAAVIHHSDQGSQGEFKRSSQHLDRGELRWLLKSAVQIDAGEHRCGRRGGLRQHGGRTISGFGQRLRRAVQPRTLLSTPECRPPWVAGGSGGRAA